MKKYWLVISIIMAVSPIHAQIYKWVDSDGNVNFSDKPHPGAEEIPLPKVQTYSSPQIPVKETQDEALAE